MSDENFAKSIDGQSTNTKMDIVFRYYEDQWAHVRHHESQRSSLTLQLLVLSATLIVAYLQMSAVLLRGIISGLIMSLGILGFLIVIKTEKAVQQHMKRARAARRSLGFLEEFVKASDFPRLYLYYAIFYLFIMLMGTVLFWFSFA